MVFSFFGASSSHRMLFTSLPIHEGHRLFYILHLWGQLAELFKLGVNVSQINLLFCDISLYRLEPIPDFSASDNSLTKDDRMSIRLWVEPKSDAASIEVFSMVSIEVSASFAFDAVDTSIVAKAPKPPEALFLN